jgi:hypothetical protein
MTTYCIFDTATGLFKGKLSLQDGAQLAANVPAGCGAIHGDHDIYASRVDVQTGEVIEYIPPAPEPESDHEWNPDSRRWTVQPASIERSTQRAIAVAELEALDRKQARAAAELLLDAKDATARAFFEKFAAEKEAQRRIIREIDAQTKTPQQGRASSGQKLKT